MEENHDVALLIGKNVCLYEDEIKLRTGLLLAVKSDHLVLYEETEGVVYYRKERVTDIRAISSSSSKPEEMQGEQLPDYIDLPSLDAVLTAMQSRHVCIHGEGEVRTEGILTEVFPNRLVLAHEDDLVIFFKAHLYCIQVVGEKQERVPEKSDAKDCIRMGRWEWPYENFRWWLKARKIT
ncbi:hypothetical protein JQN58_14475 [Aneurinibacillus sp. BA2021]|nr:hypothetical protein [Aneurinibacillus sp. BA2021]